MPKKKRGRGNACIGYKRKHGRRSKQTDEGNGQNGDYGHFFLDSSHLCDLKNSYEEGNSRDLDSFEAQEFYLIADKVIKLSPTDDAERIYFQRMLSAERYNIVKDALVAQYSRIQEDTGFLMMKSTTIKFVQLYDTLIPGVKCAVTIEPVTFKASVTVHRKLVSTDHDVWNLMPNCVFTTESIIGLLHHISAFGVCAGNPDYEFHSIHPGISALHEPDFGAICGNMEYSRTVRHNKCELLVRGLRCKMCIELRGSLRKKKSVAIKRRSESKDYTNIISNRASHKNMSREFLCEKVAALQKARCALESQNVSLKKKLEKAIDMSHEVPKVTNSDIQSMVNECSEDVMKEFPDKDTFERLFWEEQMKYNKYKNPSSMRWHPMIIKWCLQIKGRSSKAYETLRDIGFVKLPSSRTLYNYSHFLQTSCAVTLDTINHLIGECKSKGIYDTEWRSYVGILQDEIKIKDDLVYDKHSGELVGFIDLDKTGNQLIQLEHQLNGSKNQLAKSMLVVMVRGIGTNLKYPLACYATNGITADFLYPIIYEAFRALEVHVGLKVMFITCDGASANRKFFAMHGNEDTNWTSNPYDPDRKIFFISDVPHLIKTCRNCFANSYSHKRTRKLWNCGKSISWMHIVDLYNMNVSKQLYSYCPKLTRQHIDLDAHSRMNVSLAAQVLSSSVANALEYMFGDEASETVKFIQYLDKFFDCLNTKNLNEGSRKRKPNLDAYRTPTDERLTWLENDFLQYFTEWGKSVEQRPGEFTSKDRSAMKLSSQTLTGLKITVLSIVELTRFLLCHDVPFVLTSVFNQDPLEQQFGHCRHVGGSKDNPNVFDVRHSLNRLRVMGSTALALPGGNTKPDDGTRVIDNTPLPKRQRKT